MKEFWVFHPKICQLSFFLSMKYGFDLVIYRKTWLYIWFIWMFQSFQFHVLNSLIHLLVIKHLFEERALISTNCFCSRVFGNYHNPYVCPPLQALNTGPFVVFSPFHITRKETDYRGLFETVIVFSRLILSESWTTINSSAFDPKTNYFANLRRWRERFQSVSNLERESNVCRDSSCGEWFGPAFTTDCAVAHTNFQERRWTISFQWNIWIKGTTLMHKWRQTHNLNEKQDNTRCLPMKTTGFIFSHPLYTY